jgi:hypothetical protein
MPGSGSASTGPGWDIELAANTVADAAADVQASELDIALIEAQLADHYRDCGIPPLEPAQLRVVTAKMEPADWQRMAVIVALFAVPELRSALPEVSQRMHVRTQIEGLVREAQALASLELRILAASLVRAEELARRAARALNTAIAGETSGQSATRLAKIDYTRLLASVDTAKAAAAAQLAELLRQQEAEDSRVARRRRGKW